MKRTLILVGGPAVVAGALSAGSGRGTALWTVPALLAFAVAATVFTPPPPVLLMWL